MMITPRDKEYKETKLLKLGKKELLAPFKELAEWLNQKFNVIVLNVYYDLIQNSDRPRLNIVFEFEKDCALFRDVNGNYDTDKQKIIANYFKKLLQTEKSSEKSLSFNFSRKSSKEKFSTSNIWVTFSSFERIAKDDRKPKYSRKQNQEFKN